MKPHSRQGKLRLKEDLHRLARKRSRQTIKRSVNARVSPQDLRVQISPHLSRDLKTSCRPLGAITVLRRRPKKRRIVEFKRNYQ